MVHPHKVDPDSVSARILNHKIEKVIVGLIIQSIRWSICVGRGQGASALDVRHWMRRIYHLSSQLGVYGITVGVVQEGKNSLVVSQGIVENFITAEPCCKWRVESYISTGASWWLNSDGESECHFDEYILNILYCLKPFTSLAELLRSYLL